MHAGGVLADALLSKQTPATLRMVFAAKVHVLASAIQPQGHIRGLHKFTSVTMLN